ncbi:amino acid permease [Halorussus halobius]|uniref:amino acid permease n=1 Tax=Halorussus halobius TaxID=1710537 RepID=UPI0010929A48|nr:amino acid permease [Halorussus halobius]
MSEEELAKDLGLPSALAIGMGTMIGAGIFVLPGVAAQEAGPVVVASFVVGGLIAMVNALAVSELGTAMPKAGGGYYYINRGLGPLFGSISGMGDWMGLAFASAFYCIGFGGYLTDLLAGTALALPTLDLGLLVLTDVQLGAALAGVLFVGINYAGAKETGNIQTGIVVVLLGILTVFAASGLFHFEWATVTGEGGVAPMGMGAILPGTALVFVSFLGYAKIATVAEELKNPGRNLPIAVIGSVGVVTVVYAILVGMMVGIVPWNGLDDNVPVSQVAEITFAGVPVLDAVGVTLISLAAMLATASSANASILSSARINFAMGRDRIVTDWLNEIHPTFATPYRSILLTGSVIVVFILTLGQDLEVLSKAASVLHLVVYGLMNVALIAFREADVPEYDPDFEVPLYPVTPIVGLVSSFGLVGFMAPVEIGLALGFVAVAVLWYALYARTQATQQGVLGQYVLERSEEMPDAAVTAASAAQPDGSGRYRVMVPLANPETERHLVELASALAAERNGVVHAVHVVQVPDQTSLDQGADRIGDESRELLERAREHAAANGADVETTTIVSHQSVEEVFDAAREHRADQVVMGWGGDRPWSAGRAESAVEELAHDLPCDFLVLKDRGFDPARILVPTAGGPDSDLSVEVARTLRSATGSEIHLLHVVDDESEREAGERFLAEWAAEHGFGDAVLTVDDSGDVEDAIAREAADKTLVVIGATERGLLSRLVSRSLVFDVVDDIDSSVLLAERPSDRSLRERLFG